MNFQVSVYKNVQTERSYCDLRDETQNLSIPKQGTDYLKRGFSHSGAFL